MIFFPFLLFFDHIASSRENFSARENDSFIWCDFDGRVGVHVSARNSFQIIKLFNSFKLSSVELKVAEERARDSRQEDYNECQFGDNQFAIRTRGLDSASETISSAMEWMMPMVAFVQQK